MGLRCVPHGLWPLPAGPSGFSPSRASSPSESWCRGVPRDLRLTFRAPDGCGSTRVPLPTFGSFASLGFRSSCVSPLPLVRPAPLSRDPTTLSSRGTCASTPGDVSAAIVALAYPAIAPVPPSWFRTTSTVSSAQGFRACCIPVPEGVRRVSPSRPPLVALRRPEDRRPLSSGGSRGSPLRTSHPSKKSPRQQPFHIAVAVAPSPLCRRASLTSQFFAMTLDLEALLRCRVRSAVRPLPVDRRPLLPWALRPSRVLADSGSLDPTRLRIGPLESGPPSVCDVAIASSRRPRRCRWRSAFTESQPIPCRPSGWRVPVARNRVRFDEPPRPSVCSRFRARVPPEWVGHGPRLRTLLGLLTSKNKLTPSEEGNQPRLSAGHRVRPECRDGHMRDPCQLLADGKTSLIEESGWIHVSQPSTRNRDLLAISEVH